MQMQNTETEKRPHELSMKDRGQMRLTGVEKVENFDEEELELLTSRGRLTIQGHNLHVSRFNEESGDLAGDGTLDAMIYSGEARDKRGFWARLLG